MNLIAGLGLCLFGALAPLCAQNSTKKIRTAPSELAARAGSAVGWRENVDAALAEAKTSGKPVFWYVPSVAGSPMDRKPEIDRYMLGGPFSWPSTVELLRTHFVPVAAPARGELQKRYGLTRGKFIEPGYLVLDGDGEVRLRVDQITTFHPQWFEAPLRRCVQQPIEHFPCDVALKDAWATYRRGDFVAVEGAVAAQQAQAEGSGQGAARAMEGLWLRAAAKARLGEPRESRKILQQIVDTGGPLLQESPGLPFVHKAALELEGHGPFVHGFEVYAELPATVLAKDPTDGSRAPAGVYTEAELWQRCVAYLLSMDDGDGVVRDSTYDFGGTDGLPNVHAAVTCLVGEALLAAADRQRRGELDLAPPVVERLEAMLQQILHNVESETWLALSDRDEIVWARAYALRFLAAWRTFRASDAERLQPAFVSGVGALLALQPETGVWFHEYGNPFAIATALQALHAARGAGVEVDQQKIDRGLKALAHNRTREGAFTYGHTQRGEPRASVVAAAGRMPLCELALFLFGASDQQRLRQAVEAGGTHHAVLAAVRKYDDHADQHGYGGFFFWFDMLGRVEAALRLEDQEARAAFVAQNRRLVLELPEFDGCFVDSHELGRAYGTAMALLCLDTLHRGDTAARPPDPGTK